MKDSGFAPIRWYRSLRSFVKEAAMELGRVIWPSSEELKAYTYLVIFVIVTVAVFIGVIELTCLELSEAVHLYGRGASGIGGGAM